MPCYERHTIETQIRIERPNGSVTTIVHQYPGYERHTIETQIRIERPNGSVTTIVHQYPVFVEQITRREFADMLRTVSHNARAR